MRDKDRVMTIFEARSSEKRTYTVSGIARSGVVKAEGMSSAFGSFASKLD